MTPMDRIIKINIPIARYLRAPKSRYKFTVRRSNQSTVMVTILTSQVIRAYSWIVPVFGFSIGRLKMG